MTDEQLVEIMKTLGRLDERSERMEKVVSGNGMPGLVQRVEKLEATENQRRGARKLIVLIGGGLWGLLEYLFHMRGGK